MNRVALHQGRRHLSSISFDQSHVRRSVLISSWIIVLLGIPLWWVTTAIERLPLPSTSQMAAWPIDELESPLRINLIPGPLRDSATSLALQLQLAFASERNISVEVRYQAPNLEGYTVEIIKELDHPIVNSRHLSVPVHSALANFSELLYPLILPYVSGHRRGSFGHLVTQYATRYRLAFTLLNEDAAAGKAVTGWDFHSGFRRYISPILNRLSALHNFTVESQVLFYGPLAFEPLHVQSDQENVYGLTQDDLKVFVNSAEWSLASQVSNDPVLHFIVFVPSPSHTPLRILDRKNKVIPSDAFILPQWGGVFIANQPSDAQSLHPFSFDDLSAAFMTFRQQLLTLLGVSGAFPEYEIIDTSVSDWQLDSLYHRRTRENIISSRETLESIVKLVDQIPNMPVGANVRSDFQTALNALQKAHSTPFMPPLLALRNSIRAVTHASRAFFSPGMLALLYFPPEHTYAVYTPLFVPMLGPLVATAIREIKSWKQTRKEVSKQGTRAKRD